MKSTTLRRAAALSAGAALALAGLSTAPATAAQIPAPAGADPAPAAVGAVYLAAQAGPDGIIQTYFAGTGYADPGVTIDAALALDAVDGQAAKVAAMAAGVEASSYPAGSAGSASKFAAAAYTLGRSGAVRTTAVEKVNTSISTTAPTVGRLQETSGDDYNSPLTQAYAVNALADAGATNAEAARTFLLTQQCAAGFFRASFSPKANLDQSCDGAGNATPSIDTTAIAVLNLQDQKALPAVATSLNKAVTWLVSQQAANGSFSAGNANATGLAGWALGVSGRTAEAAKAATWLRAHQLVNAGTCTRYPAALNGGVALDDLGFANAATGPVSNDDRSVITRATSQALPALLWAPGGAAAGETKLTGPGEFVKAGTAHSVAVAGAPGDTLCITVNGATNRVVLPATGATTVPVTLPAATTTTATVRTVDAGGEVDTLNITGLAAAKLKGKAPRKVELGDKFRVKVTGLAPGEELVAKYRGKKVTDEANGKGVAKVRLKAIKLGKAKVKLRGEFGYRSGKIAVITTR